MRGAKVKIIAVSVCIGTYWRVFWMYLKSLWRPDFEKAYWKQHCKKLFHFIAVCEVC